MRLKVKAWLVHVRFRHGSWKNIDSSMFTGTEQRDAVMPCASVAGIHGIDKLRRDERREPKRGSRCHGASYHLARSEDDDHARRRRAARTQEHAKPVERTRNVIRLPMVGDLLYVEPQRHWVWLVPTAGTLSSVVPRGAWQRVVPNSPKLVAPSYEREGAICLTCG